MPETFFISDTHFGHKNIIKFDATRPFRQFDTIEEHDAELVRRWNAVVGKHDSVWHLGDFAFGKAALEIAAQLNGTKRLVLGNHDLVETKEYLKYFTRLSGVIEYKDVVLSHAPVHVSQLDRWKANVHGHVHTASLPDPRYINVSCEAVNLTPISFDEIKKRAENVQRELR